MNCPRCREPTYVVDTRQAGITVRRRRVCRMCSTRVTTFESPMNLPDLLLALKTRLRHLEGELQAVADAASLYMSAKLRRPKRGPSRSRRVDPLLSRRCRSALSPDETARMLAAYKKSSAAEVAAAFGCSIALVRKVAHKQYACARTPGAQKPNGGAA